MFDIDVMRTIVDTLFMSRISAVYGQPGVSALTRLLPALQNIHRMIAVEALGSPLVVVAPLERGLIRDILGEPDSASIAGISSGPVTVEVSTTGSISMWRSGLPSLEAVAPDAIVYEYDREDAFIIGGRRETVPNPSGNPSAFGVPTFFALDDALKEYNLTQARESTCVTLRRCWRNEVRWLFKNKPESTMRDSLTQFLRVRLRGHGPVEVRAEQNVDESHPVDIKVTWTLTNRIALIEVKWLGASVNESDDAISKRYGVPRAQEGAAQLANYLEANSQSVPELLARGYLVVFDGRRRNPGRGFRMPPERPSAADASYYRDADITYNPPYHELRADFAPPVRIFLEAYVDTAA